MDYSFAETDEQFLIRLIRSTHDTRLRRLHFHITGDYPYQESYVGRWIETLGGICRNPYSLPFWPAILEDIDSGIPKEEICGFREGEEYLGGLNFIVLGQQRFNKAFLEFSLIFCRQNEFYYLSQEAFLLLLRGETVQEYYLNDPRIIYHPALTFLTTIGFTWPSTELSKRFSFNYKPDGNLADISDLRYHGYSVAAGVSLKNRRFALQYCVSKFGLEYVAKKVAWLARMRKGRNDDIMYEAVRRYEDDLGWLKSNFYNNSRFDFTWPDY